MVAHARRPARGAGVGLGARLKLAQRERRARGGHRAHRVDVRSAPGAQRPLQFRASSAWSSRSTRRTPTASRAARCTRARQPIASSPSGTSRAARRAPHRARGDGRRARRSRSGAPLVNPSAQAAHWLAPGPAIARRRRAAVLVEIPAGFAEMQLGIRRSRWTGACNARDLPVLLRARLSGRRFLSRRARRDEVTTCSAARSVRSAEVQVRSSSHGESVVTRTTEAQTTSSFPAARSALGPPSTCRWMWKTV